MALRTFPYIRGEAQEAAMAGTRAPKAEKGKAGVGLNDVRHGIQSHAPVVDGFEEEEAWIAHLEGVTASLAPDGYLEIELARRIAALQWRLRRVERYETARIEKQRSI